VPLRWQRYVLAKHTLPIEVDFMLKDTLEVGDHSSAWA